MLTKTLHADVYRDGGADGAAGHKSLPIEEFRSSIEERIKEGATHVNLFWNSWMLEIRFVRPTTSKDILEEEIEELEKELAEKKEKLSEIIKK